MCVVGHSTHYPRGSSWEIDILPSRVVTDVKTAVQRNWVARAYVSIGVPPSWRLGLITRSVFHSECGSEFNHS